MSEDVYGQGFRLESHPTYEQKGRLEDFLDELMLLSRKYGLLIDSSAAVEAPTVLDLSSGTVIGLKLMYLVREPSQDQVVLYDFDGGSILDGTWLVDTEEGPVEQRMIDGRYEITKKRIEAMRTAFMPGRSA